MSAPVWTPDQAPQPVEQPLRLRIERDVKPSEVAELIDEFELVVFDPILTWWRTFSRTKDGGIDLRHDDLDDGREGNAKRITHLTPEQLVAAVSKALIEQPQAMCCAESMIDPEQGLGYACVQDADTVLQLAVYGGELVFG